MKEERPKARHKLSRRKRLLFAVWLAVLVYGAIELFSLSLLLLMYGSLNAVHDKQESVSEPHLFRPMVKPKDEVIHPYLGWVLQPEADSSGQPTAFRVNEFGFVDKQPPIQKRSDDKVIIGIVGGSVAQEFSLTATEPFAAGLCSSPEYSGKELVFVRAAIGGYKQPQQLLVVTYLLTLGAEFDAIVNIDGFNEVALPWNENVPHHVHTAFPRDWHTRVTEANDLPLLRRIGRVTYLRSLRAELTRSVQDSWVGYSPTMQVAWAAGDEFLTGAIMRDLHQIDTNADRSFRARGPSQAFADELELEQALTEYWMKCSWQLHQLCQSKGIKYYHFLQPNQYLPGTHVMPREEQKVAYSIYSSGKVPVERCYPLLIQKGAELKRRGVRFHDLTRIFEDESAPVYSDKLCHLNALGNTILAREMAAAICEGAQAGDDRP